MKKAYHIAYLDDVDESALDVIGPGIHFYNKEQAGDNEHQRLCFALYASDGTIVGGLVGETSWGWLHVDLLWLPEELRGYGYGRRLLTLAEEEGRRRGARNVYLDTFSFQAPGFYEECGYRRFGELEDFPPGHRRYFYRKALQ